MILIIKDKFHLNKERILVKFYFILADKNGIKFLETSAKETVNIDELFVSASKTFLEKAGTISAKNPKKTPGNSILLNSNQENKTDDNSNNQNNCC